MRPGTAFTLAILLIACSGDERAVLGPEESTPAALRITPDAETLTAIGDTVRLVAEVRDQSNQPIAGATLQWSSLEGAVASVSGAGLVQARAPGTARIVAVSGLLADTVLITVQQAAAEVEVTPAVASVARGRGDTVRFAAWVRDANGHDIDGAPVDWSSGDPAIATVDGNGLATATMQGGGTQIIATSGAASGYASLTALDELLFVSNRDGNDEIYTMNADGSSQTNLTNHGASDTEPAWSPDGSTIAFTSDRNVQLDILVMNADGSGLTNLTSGASDGANFEPAWSPDGARIAFRSTRTLDFEVYIMDADGSRVTNLSSDAAFDGEPLWSPNGNTIAFVTNRDGNDEIYVVSPGGGTPTNLTQHGQSDVEHAWSPDGTMIAFRSFRAANQDIYVMSATGLNQTRLTSTIAFDGEPVWSPDGSKIAFVTARDGNLDIYVMNADGGGAVNLTRNAGADDQPAWSPDGSQIAFRSDRDGNREIYVMNADGSGATRLTTNAADDGAPSWRPVP